MSFVEDMDEIIENTIREAEMGFSFEYSFAGDTHDLVTEENKVSIHPEVHVSASEWEVYAEVKNRAGETVERFLDGGDSLKEIKSGRFKNIFNDFFETNILPYFDELSEE